MNHSLWLLPVLLRLGVAYLVADPLAKFITGKPARSKSFVINYIFCLVCAVVLVLVLGDPFYDQHLWLFLFFGVANGFAAYARWKAMDISLSKTSLFTMGDDIIAMGLSCIFLGETKLLKGWILLGIALSFSSLILLLVRNYRKKKMGEPATTPLSFFGFLAVYSIIWGGT